MGNKTSDTSLTSLPRCCKHCDAYGALLRLTDLRLMKRTLMAITAVSLVASTAFAGPIHTATEEYNLPSQTLSKRP